MRGLIRRAVVAAGTAVVLLGPAVGAASAASGTVVLVWSPTTSSGTYSYGTLNLGQSASQTFTLINSGSTISAALKVTLTGSAAFTKLGDTCNGTKLKPNTSCRVIVQYAPAAAQTGKATLTAASSKPAATVSLTLLGQAKASPVLSTSQVPATGPVGTVLQDSASLTGGSSPTGTIEFKLYATADCSGSPVDDEKVTITGSGTYRTSAGYKAAGAGTYQWTATYSGDANNNAIPATTCGQEPVTVNPLASPALSTRAFPTTGLVGTNIFDSATLTGGNSPTGTLDFKLYATADCSGAPVLDEPMTVNGNGQYDPTTGWATVTAGTYQWVVTYSGDNANNSAATNCGDEPVTITGATPDNNANTAIGLGTLNCGQSLTKSGVNVGTSNAWYLVTLGSCSLHLAVSGSGDVMDVLTSPGSPPLATGVTSDTESTDGTYYVRVYEGSSGTNGPFTLTASAS